MIAVARAVRLACTLGAWLSGSVLLGSACATHADAIERGRRYYEDNQYERALALWRDLERRGARLAPAERARFAYFRGMTDYRLGFREEARHWLAVALAGELEAAGALRPEWRERLKDALVDLDRAAAGVGPARVDVVQTIEAPAGAATPGGPGEPPDAAGPRPFLPVVPPVGGLAAPEEPGAAEPAPPERPAPRGP